MSHGLRVVVNRDQCFSFGVCVETVPSVFVWDEEDKPVIQAAAADKASLDQLTEAVDGCPRSALTLVDKDGQTIG